MKTFNQFITEINDNVDKQDVISAHDAALDQILNIKTSADNRAVLITKVNALRSHLGQEGRVNPQMSAEQIRNHRIRKS